MSTKLKTITEKKAQLDRLKPFPSDLIQNLDAWYRTELTYNSNAIEGNTLSRAETEIVIEKGIAIGGKTLVEHLEAVNHNKALSLIQSLKNTKRHDITERTILDIHSCILDAIDDDNAGRYRRIPVRIAGSSIIMPNPIKVPDLMKEFIAWLHTNFSDKHSVTIAAKAHHKLVGIHPFVDGNGRTARLLMNLILLQEGYPLVIIENKDRKAYIDAIEKAQLGGMLDDFFDIVYAAVEKSLDVYLESVEKMNFQIDLTSIK